MGIAYYAPAVQNLTGNMLQQQMALGTEQRQRSYLDEQKKKEAVAALDRLILEQSFKEREALSKQYFDDIQKELDRENAYRNAVIGQASQFEDPTGVIQAVSSGKDISGFTRRAKNPDGFKAPTLVDVPSGDNKWKRGYFMPPTEVGGRPVFVQEGSVFAKESEGASSGGVTGGVKVGSKKEATYNSISRRNKGLAMAKITTRSGRPAFDPMQALDELYSSGRPRVNPTLNESEKKDVMSKMTELGDKFWLNYNELMVKDLRHHPELSEYLSDFQVDVAKISPSVSGSPTKNIVDSKTGSVGRYNPATGVYDWFSKDNNKPNMPTVFPPITLQKLGN